MKYRAMHHQYVTLEHLYWRVVKYTLDLQMHSEVQVAIYGLQVWRDHESVGN